MITWSTVTGQNAKILRGPILAQQTKLWTKNRNLLTFWTNWSPFNPVDFLLVSTFACIIYTSISGLILNYWCKTQIHVNSLSNLRLLWVIMTIYSTMTITKKCTNTSCSVRALISALHLFHPLFVHSLHLVLLLLWVAYLLPALPILFLNKQTEAQITASHRVPAEKTPYKLLQQNTPCLFLSPSHLSFIFAYWCKWLWPPCLSRCRLFF